MCCFDMLDNGCLTIESIHFLPGAQLMAAELKTDLEIIKIVFDIVKIFVDWIAIAIGAVFALAVTYGIALRWSEPKEDVVNLFYWPPSSHDLSLFPILSLQVWLRNPVMGSQVSCEVEFKDLVVEQEGGEQKRSCRLSPQLLLEPFVALKDPKETYKP